MLEVPRVAERVDDSLILGLFQGLVHLAVGRSHDDVVLFAGQFDAFRTGLDGGADGERGPLSELRLGADGRIEVIDLPLALIVHRGAGPLVMAEGGVEGLSAFLPALAIPGVEVPDRRLVVSVARHEVVGRREREDDLPALDLRDRTVAVSKRPGVPDPVVIRDGVRAVVDHRCGGIVGQFDGAGLLARPSIRFARLNGGCRPAHER